MSSKLQNWKLGSACLRTAFFPQNQTRSPRSDGHAGILGTESRDHDLHAYRLWGNHGEGLRTIVIKANRGENGDKIVNHDSV